MGTPKRINNRKPNARPAQPPPPGTKKTEVVMLVDQAASGSFDAFGQLYEMFLDKIYRYAFYQVRDKMTAEDVTETVFMKAWKQIASCKGQGSTFSAWLYRIAHNQIVDTLKSGRSVAPLDLEDISNLDSPELNPGIPDEAEELADMMAELPEAQKQVIILKFIEGLNNTEISHVLNKSEQAIRILQMRGLARMREKFREGQVRQ
jgi:RNA polymerase sigma-70 factor (ECF subfamily)